uniref:AAA+ ATPase domain-containing protein n=1 Tax=Populus davidiana TaxID=266767 RepID=A0A6M2E7H0_9ROSI
MYTGIFKCRNQRWCSFFHPSKHFIRPNCQDRPLSCTTVVRDHLSHVSFIKRQLLHSISSRSTAFGNSDSGLHIRSNMCWTNIQFRTCSSGANGRNTSEDKHGPVKDGASFDNEKTQRERVSEEAKHCDAHAQLGEQDQKEWLHNEKLAIESKRKESPFLTRREKFKNEFLRRIVPWEKLHVSWDNFPYYINEHTKNTLVECVASHLKHKKCTTSYGARLTSSSGRIMLQSVPGTELYRERTVKALARDLKVPLLVLDSSVLAPYDFGDDEIESDDSAGEESCSESEVEDDTDAVNEEEWTSSAEAKSDCSDDDAVDLEANAEAALKKLLPCSLEEFEKRVSAECDSSSESSKNESAGTSEIPKRPLNKGDRVKYVGPSIRIEADDRVILGKIPTSDGLKNAYTTIRGRPLSSGQLGEVYEVNGDRVAVILDSGNDNKEDDGEKDEKLTEQPAKAPVYWIDAKDIEHDPDTGIEYCYIAMEVLCEVLHSVQPLIVYFPDSSQWLSRAVPKSNRKDFLSKVQEMFDKLSGPVVLICGQNKAETGSKEKERFTMLLPNLGRLAKLPLSLKHLTDGLRGAKRSNENDITKLFTNILCLNPPKEEDLLRTFNKQVEEDRRIVISRSNLIELHKVLEENEMSCMDLLHINTDGLILTKRKAEKVIGWAKNHYLSSCLLPCIKGDRLSLPRESLEMAIMRLKEQETISEKPSQNLKNLAKDEYESNFVSAVVAPGEIGVKFNDVGALEEVKKALNELVILPMRRPELFSHGNLLRPCKGILLFGPPGTGKTLLAKALATEAGANFISITGSTLTSKWFGDAEKLTKALFSFASKLAPVIIFVDEVDSLLGARGGSFEHEATRRMRNEFMAAWDGLRSKDSQRILILGATNRPFDLDDAVIRRLPRRIHVDLPDAENRMKILRIILNRENLEADFQFDKLANATEGYSGSDLKNLCIAAAYRPVEELLEEEKGGKNGATLALRPLNLEDFIQSKAKVGPSVSFDAASMNELRKWNEQYGEGGNRKKSPFGF